MIRVVIVLALFITVAFALGWAYRWLARNRVRVSVTRPPTGREIILLSVILQALRALLRSFLRRI